MKKKKIILTPAQAKVIDLKFKQAQFDRLGKVILENKRLSPQKRAEMIVALKKKIFTK
jgi:hypothetical protein